MISRSIKNYIIFYDSNNTHRFKQIPVPPQILDEMEQLYAPPDHPVFVLVPPAFHERATELYRSIGEPEVTVATFWDIYHSLLERLREHQENNTLLDLPEVLGSARLTRLTRTIYFFW